MGFPEDSIAAHNVYREKHGVPLLKLTKGITDIAQKWADHLASTGTFSHSKERSYNGEKMGENIAMKWTSSGEDFTGQQVTDQWYSEVEKYDYSKASNAGTGHFTQVVWNASREFGIGKAKAKDGKWIVVANYFPAGNFLGKFQDNVFPPGGKSGDEKTQDDSESKPEEGEEDKKKGTSPISGSAPSGTRSECCKENQPPAPGKTTSTSTASATATATTTDKDGKMSGTSVSRSTRTERVTEDRGQGLKTYVKTIVTETTVTSDGRKTVSTTETETTEDPGAASGGATSDKDKKKPQKMKDFIDEVVKMHNKYRKTHGKVGDLKHNKELSVLAQRWADHLAATKVLKHSDDTYKGQTLGENVASKWSSAGADYTGAEVVDQWYSEVSKYDYGVAEFKQGTGHFTQVVWKGSKEIGVGKALTEDGRVFVVCNYNPAGNVVGQFGDNVFPAK